MLEKLKSLWSKMFPPAQYMRSGQKMILPLTTYIYLGKDKKVWGWIHLYYTGKGKVSAYLKIPPKHKMKQLVEKEGKTLQLQFDDVFDFKTEEISSDILGALSKYGEYEPAYVYNEIVKGLFRLKKYSKEPYFC